jgi:hypothetical protein
MHRTIAAGVVAWVFLLSSDAVACQSDRDCSAASRCVRAFGQLEGVCERGVAPVEGNERRPFGAPDAPKRREGQACELSIDCFYPLTCVLQPNTNQGVCTR